MSKIVINNEIKSLLVDVSEEIENKNLKKFIFTSLKLNNLSVNKNDFVSINFISELNKYQVLIFLDYLKSAIFQIFEQFYLYKKDINSFDLYLTNEFFCLYKNGEFYYYQNLESKIPINDLIEYVNKSFSIKIDNFEVIDEVYQKELEKLYLEKEIKNRLQNFNSKNDYAFKIYLFYILIVLCFSIFSYENNLEIKEEKSDLVIENNFEKIKKEHTFIPLSFAFNDLLLVLKKFNLNLESFEYKENGIKIVFSSMSKLDIYSFFKELKDKLISQEINYLENKEIYQSVIYVKLPR
jgi:hypothetical protein